MCLANLAVINMLFLNNGFCRWLEPTEYRCPAEVVCNDKIKDRKHYRLKQILFALLYILPCTDCPQFNNR